MLFERRLEAGPWFEASRRLDSTEAESYYGQLCRNEEAARRRYCIYVHVPFCNSICSFCALYTHAVSKDADAVFEEFLAFTVRHIESHPAAGTSNAPTTVHFGGGTPLHPGLERFSVIVETLRNAFGDSPACEWAIETTTSSIDDATLAVLQHLGFRRIHLGIQTLDDGIRSHIGRHETGGKALEKIQNLLSMDFQLSIDLIVGLPNSHESVVRRDLELLYDAGIRMFSICALRERSRIEPSPSQIAEQEKNNYACWKTIWRFMQDHDLRPIHIGQFARSYEDNLYFTHPARREDCIAIGPYAHGSCGGFYYSNKLLPDYYHALGAGLSPIGLGVVYDDDVEVLRGLERELLAHRIRPETVGNVVTVYGSRFEEIWNSWIENGLIRESSSDRAYVPSMDGSWYIGNMVRQGRNVA
ncbi:MAG: radical SAM protein [Acidobacteria bacterium]|nr:radical SAM protein [Acidobacteriota bacterium]